MNRNKMKYSFIDQDDLWENEDIILIFEGAKKFQQEIMPVPCLPSSGAPSHHNPSEVQFFRSLV